MNESLLAKRRGSDSTIRILHLEDSRLDAELIQGALASHGSKFEIHLAIDRLEFESALKLGGWDLVICDYNVPGYDGTAALKLARETFPNVPVIMISGGLSEEEAVKCLHMGASDYLLKQSLVRLPSAIERALAQASEHRLRQAAEAKFRNLVEFASEAMLIVDANGFIDLVNAQTEKLFGYARDEMLGKPIEILMPLRFRSRHAVHVDSYFVAPEVRIMGSTIDLIGLRKDGSEFPAEVGLSPLETPDGRLVTSVVRDLTERRKLESQLLRSKRIESIGTFAGSIAHDLNNALAPVLMSLELLRLQNPGSKDLVGAIEAGANRGAEMLRQLLVFSQGSYVEPSSVDPYAILAEVGTLVRRALPSSIAFQVNPSPELRSIWGDATQIHQVIYNLCINARDAMPAGGVLRLTVDLEEVDPETARDITSVAPGCYIVIRVSDTGMGMPPEVLDRIFEPFFTTKSHGKGTGLGLSIVSGIVRSHKGFVQVLSEPMKGSVFSVYLPIDHSSESITAQKIIEKRELHGNQEPILVVDDSDAIRQVARAALSAMNYRVKTAANGMVALEVIRHNAEGFKIMITDLDMPMMNGFDLITSVKRACPDIGIIVMSGILDEATVRTLRKSGVTVFLRKPFTHEVLLEAVYSILERVK